MPTSIEKAAEIIIDAINKGTRHANYKWVTELADLYLSLITGEGASKLLKQFKLREDDEAFAQRVLLSILTTEPLCRSLMNPFEKVLRTDPLVKRIESKDEVAIKVLSEKLEKFYHSENQNSGLDYWLQTRFKSLSFTDPNAFIVMEWGNFNPNIEKATPYPYEVSSKQAINFNYENNKLDFLLDKRPIMYAEKENGEIVQKSGSKYTLYGVGYALVYEQVGKDYIPAPGESVYVTKSEEKYVVRSFDTKLDQVPAFVIGYLGDDLTKSVTYVNPFHAAIPWFKKIVGLISEADLSKTNHSFPQKYQYVQSCPGENNMVCHGGKNSDGHTCKMCHGKGIVMHSSSQDAVILPLPRKPDDVFDLSKLSFYNSPPVELLQFQEDIIDKYEGKIHASVFNTQAMVKKKVVATATERVEEQDNLNDTLHPFAEKVTSGWCTIVANIAYITETHREDLIIDHRYPSDFKYKSLSTLIADLAAANDSGAPSFVISKINDDIAEQTFVDQPEEYNKYQIKQRFYPFPGKGSDEISLIMVQDFIPLKTKLLYSNFDMLFMRAAKENVGFWQMKEQAQEVIIDKYLAELEALLKPKEIVFNPLA